MDASQRKVLIENPSAIVYDRKFDTAIRDTFFINFTQNQLQRQKILPTKKNNKYDDYILDDVAKNHPDLVPMRTPDHYGLFLHKILTSHTLLRKCDISVHSFPRLKKMINENLEFQLNFCTKQSYIHSTKNALEQFQIWKQNTNLPVILVNLLQISDELGLMIDKANKMYGRKYRQLNRIEYHEALEKLNVYTIKELDVTFRWSESLFYILIDGNLYVQPRSVMLMYHNKISDLVSVLTFSLFAQGNDLPMNAFNTTVSFIKEMIIILIKYKNEAFSIFKVLEGLVAAESLIETEEWKNDAFLNNLVDDLINKVKFNYLSSRLRQALLIADIPFRHNLGCLSKILGHPLVSIEAGVKKLHKNVNEDIKVSPIKIRDCINHFKRDYIKKHIQKHKIWPPVEPLSPHAPKALRMACLYGKDPDAKFIKDRWGDISLDFYEYIELKKNAEFHELENIIPYLKDKTISMLRSDVLLKYFDQQPVVKEWQKTRLLLSYLLNPSMVHDHIGFLRKYSNSQDFEQLMNYLIIRLVPKEKELKIEFRGFGCKTYEDRHRSLAQEKNVSIFLGEYSDEQTLTCSELQILKRLDAFRRITSAYIGHYVLYLVIDASSWNNRFSARTVDDFNAETLDPLFDSKLFSKTHAGYEHTMMYIPDGATLYYWEGQRGGIEGLNQYTWMNVYNNQMRVAMSGFPYPYHIIAKGDDMRIVVLIPKNVTDSGGLGVIKNNIIEYISQTCSEFGHKVNIEESYGSSHYFAFSKAASYDTIELPQTYRKIMKVYGSNNAFITSLDDYASATFSNGHSATKVTSNVVPCYATSLLWFFHYLLRSNFYHDLTDAQLVGLSLVPSLLGGFPIIYLHNFVVRAESDLLAPFLDMCNYALQHYPSYYKSMRNFLYIRKDSVKHCNMFLRDPYSLPITRPPLTSSVLRSYIPPQLKRIAGNKDLLDLIKLSESPAQKQIEDALLSANVYRVKALSLLFSASPKALLEEYTRKFESGKSILECLLIKNPRRYTDKILRKVLQAEIDLQKWRHDRTIGKRDNYKNDISVEGLLDSQCSSNSADQIREHAYGKKIYDITMPSMQHQLSLHYEEPIDPDNWISNNHFNFQTQYVNKHLTEDGRLQYSSGDFKPFIGYTTKTGQINPQVHFLEKDETLNKVKIILDVCNWMYVTNIDEDGVNVTSNINIFCENLLRLYTDAPLHDLAPYAGERKSGTSQHHMRSPGFRESIIPNTLSNQYTYVKGESSSHNRLQLSAEHFRINFLHCYCYTVWLLNLELEFSQQVTTPRLVWCVTTDCLHCNTPIIEHPLILDPHLSSNIVLPGLRMTKINKIGEMILLKSIEAHPLDPLNITLAGDNLPYEDACLGIITHLVYTLYLNYQGIHDRYTSHAMSADGYNILQIISGHDHDREIGLTEIKALDIRGLYFNLIINIHQIIRSKIKTDSQKQLQSWLLLTPTLNLPWYPIMQWIEDAGRLPELVRLAYQVSKIPPSGCYHDVMSATRYIGRCALEDLQIKNYTPTLIYLSTYTINHLEHFLVSAFETSKKMVIRNLVDVNLIKPPSRLEEREFRQDAASTFIVAILILYVLYDPDQEIIKDWLDDLEESKVVTKPLVDLSNMTYDVLELRGEEYNQTPEDHSLWTRYINLLFRWHSIYNHETREISHPPFTDLIDRYYQQAIAYLYDHVDMSVVIVKIIYTSLIDCIQVVREHRHQVALQEIDEGDEIDEYHDVIEISRLFISLFNLNVIRDHKLKMYKSFTPLAHIYGQQLRRNHPILTITNHTFVSIDYLHRPFGSDNASSSVWLTLLHSLNIAQNVPDNIVILCTHDGLGGVTALFNSLTTNSKIVFHTVPDEHIFRPEPSTALAQGYLGNDLRYDYLTGGYSKITHSQTTSFILAESNHYDVITSDLEHPDPTSNEYYKINLALLKFSYYYLSVTGIIILRLDLRGFTNILSIIAIARHYYSRVYLTQPMGETYTPAHFLVCYGRNSIIHQDVLPINIGEQLLDCDNTYTLLLRYINGYNEVSRNLFNTSLNDILFLDIPVPTYYRYRGLAQSGIYGISRVTHLFACPLINDKKLLGESFIMYLKNLGATTNTICQELRKMNLDLTPQIQRLSGMLEKNQLIYYHDQSWDTTKKAHRLVVACHIIRMEAFMFVVLNLIKQGELFYLNIENALDYLRQRHARWKIIVFSPQSRLEIRNMIPDLTTPETRFMRAFFEGCNTALSWFGSLYILYADEIKENNEAEAAKYLDDPLVLNPHQVEDDAWVENFF